MSERIVFNGELLEAGAVPVEVGSPGLGYGLGLFETLKMARGRPVFLAEHMGRLRAGLDRLGLELPFSDAEMAAQFAALAKAVGRDEGAAKAIAAPLGSRSDVAVFWRQGLADPGEEPYRLRVSEVIRSSQAFCVRHKTLNYLENWLELQSAREAGYDECLFRNEAGSLTECATANVFFFLDGSLVTPSLDCGLLDGVIRAKVLEIAQESGQVAAERPLAWEEAAEAQGCFVTNSSLGLREVSEVADSNGESVRFETGGALVRCWSERLAALEEASLEEGVKAR